MAISPEDFYDQTRVAIVPMGFCFPGLDAHGSDLPPRRECAPLWRDRVFAAMPALEMILLVGSYAQRWHLPHSRSSSMTATVAGWRDVAGAGGPVRLFPLPHPSWRNNAWIRRNTWFEAELLPELREAVRRVLDKGPARAV
jgi:uracil-DNA glycosylase